MPVNSIPLLFTVTPITTSPTCKLNLYRDMLQECQNFVAGTISNNVGGHQINNHGTIHGNVIIGHSTEGTVARRTMYNQFREVILGDVIMIKEIQSEDLGKYDWDCTSERIIARHKARRTVYTVQFVGSEVRFTAISYKGEDAHLFWEKDFREFCLSRSPNTLQLFAINRSQVPMLIYHGELVPWECDHTDPFWKVVSFGKLTRQKGWAGREIWVDMQGKLTQGSIVVDQFISACYNVWRVPERITHVQMLEPDIIIESLRKIGSRVDSQLLTMANQRRQGIRLPNLVHDWSHIQVGTVYSSLTMEAVARLSQLPLPFFDMMHIGKSKPERTVVKTDDGRLRFKFDLRNNRMEPDWNDLHYSFAASLQDTWLSQSSKIFNELNVTDIETERYFTFFAHGSISIYSRSEIGYRDRRIPIQDDQALEEARHEPPHVYLFIEPPPLSVMEARTWMGNLYFWSFDEIGESKVSEDECYRWDLPKVWATYCPEFQTWRKDSYAALEEWQVARGFDPKTSDWARSMGYPELEVIGTKRRDRFEEVIDDTLNMPGSWKD